MPSMSNENIIRKTHTGEPGNGGEFGTHKRDADTIGLTLAAPAKDWGSVANVREGSPTPWGTADWITRVADGIVIADTSSHGGVKLSPERNREIPAALRNRSGWYEEDCEARIPAAYFPEEFGARAYGVVKTADEVRRESMESIRYWFPDQYEKATGETVLPGQSRVRDDAVAAEARKNNFVVRSATTPETEPDHVLVTARVSATGEEAEFLVPRPEYTSGIGANAFAVDPTRHRRLPASEPVQKDPLTTFTVPNLDTLRLTPAARNAVQKDLDQPWRSSDGMIRTLRQAIEEQGVTERMTYLDGAGKRSYSILQGSSAFKVSAATFKALTFIPDNRTPADLSREEYYAAQARLDKKWNPTRDERQHVAELRDIHAALANAEREAEKPKREVSEAARKAKQAARERAAVVTPV